jgi:hypothetical protein
MIGVAAAASAGVYFGRGYIDPILSMPVIPGVLTGSLLGAQVPVKTLFSMARGEAERFGDLFKFPMRCGSYPLNPSPTRYWGQAPP